MQPGMCQGIRRASFALLVAATTAGLGAWLAVIVATDGVMEWVYDCPRGTVGWKTDNPCSAVKEFVASHPEFVVETPAWAFNESPLSKNVTHWPMAWLRRQNH